MILASYVFREAYSITWSAALDCLGSGTNKPEGKARRRRQASRHECARNPASQGTRYDFCTESTGAGYIATLLTKRDKRDRAQRKSTGDSLRVPRTGGRSHLGGLEFLLLFLGVFAEVVHGRRSLFELTQPGR